MANRIVLELLADSNNLLKNLDRAQQSVNRFIDASSTAGRSLGGGVNRALDAFADVAAGGARAAGVLAGSLAAVGAAAIALTLSAGAQVEAIEMLSQKTGIATSTLQGWSVIMAENNLQGETLTSAMRTLSKQIVDARDPASKAAAAFDEMGISITELGSTDSTLRAVAERFKSMPDGPDKARIAVELFGKSGLELIPLLNKGARAFDESREAAVRFGAVLTGPQLAALSAVDDAADRLGVALQGLKLQLSAAFAPIVLAGIEKVTAAIATLTNITVNYSKALEQIKKEHPIISSLSPGTAAALAAARAAQMPPPSPPTGGAPQFDSHVAEFALASAEQQEAIGRRILTQSIERFKLTVAEGHAQEALGRTVLAITEREQAERNAAFARQLEQAEQINNLQFQKPGSSSVFDAQLAAVKALMELMPELTVQEANLLALHNSAAAQQVIDDSRMRLTLLDETAARLAVAAETEQAWADHTAAVYQRLGPLFADVELTRQHQLDAIDARLEASTAELERQLQRQLISEQEYYERLLQLDLRADTERKRVAQQFPTFWDQQLQDLQRSNVFSVSQIVSSWTNGIATMIVKGGDLKAVWEQTQIALVQAALNTAVQQAAAAALAASANQAAAASSAGVWTAAAGAIGTALGAIGVAAKSLWFDAILPALTAIGEAIMGFLSAVAAAMKATIFGIPVGVAILVGVAGIAAALVAMKAIKFAEGGIATGPTQALIGEGGSSEAVIPLNRRGAAFMRETLGLGGGVQRIEVPVYLDGRQIALAVSNRQDSALRRMGVPA
jgi:hypothetical protein